MVKTKRKKQTKIEVEATRNTNKCRKLNHRFSEQHRRGFIVSHINSQWD